MEEAVTQRPRDKRRIDPAGSPNVGRGRVSGKGQGRDLVKRRAIKLFALALVGASWAVGSVPAAAGAAGCPNEALRTGFAAALPECRAYEMVSPPDKANSDVEPRTTIPIRGVVGAEESYAFASVNGLPGSENGGLNIGNVARRGADGWATFLVMPPELNQGTAVPGLPLLLSRNLNQAIVPSRVPLTADSRPGNNLYLRTISPPSLQLITSMPGPVTTNNWLPSQFVGASNDFSRVFFQSGTKLTPDSPELSGLSRSLYEWNGSTLTNIGIPPGQTEPSSTGVVARAVSSDGGRVAFEAAGQVDLRAQGTTIEVSKPAAGVVEPGSGTAEYAGGSTDMSSVFFLSKRNLTADAFTGESSSGQKNLAPNLYRYDVETGGLVDLTVDRADERGANVMGVGANVLVSPAGDVAFFVAGGVLAPGGTVGAANVYRWSAAAGIEFVAQISPTDPWASGFGRHEETMDDVGDAVAFSSIGAPTKETPVGVKEIYHWSTSEGLTCVSCVSGASLKGAELWTKETRLNGGIGAHPMTADGTKVFFSTADRLVPQDTNGKMDAYEWVGGTVHLISTGSGEYDTEFVDATPSGSDVFIETRDRLLGVDRDENTDVYDARVGGGFPEPALSVPCEAEACRPPLEAAPPAPQVGSRSFDGPANSKPTHQKKKQKKHKHHKRRAKHHKKKAKACKAKAKRCPRASHHGSTTGKRG